MKPWLQGRLALSKQTSRFELPMDVRLLEGTCIVLFNQDAIKVAQSGFFWVTIPFNFEKLMYHHKQTQQKMDCYSCIGER